MKTNFYIDWSLNMNIEYMLAAIIEFNTDPKELLYDFADFISDYFDNPELYCKPYELIRMYKEYKDRQWTLEQLKEPG